MGNSLGPRSPDEPPLRTSLAIAGAIASGKTSVAQAVAKRLSLPHASFGDEVRRRAALAGMDNTDRRILQDLGERLVRDRPTEFADSVIVSARPRRAPGQPIVLDGLRHLHVLEVLRELLSDTGVALVYLDATFEIRERRANTHSVSGDALAVADTHESEVQSRMLRTAADLVLSVTADLDGLADQIVAHLRTL